MQVSAQAAQQLAQVLLLTLTVFRPRPAGDPSRLEVGALNWMCSGPASLPMTGALEGFGLVPEDERVRGFGPRFSHPGNRVSDWPS